MTIYGLFTRAETPPHVTGDVWIFVVSLVVDATIGGTVFTAILPKVHETRLVGFAPMRVHVSSGLFALLCSDP